MTYQIDTDAEPTTCRGCGAEIYWIRTIKGKLMPVDPDGTSHFATCPKAKSFRKPKEATP